MANEKEAGRDVDPPSVYQIKLKGHMCQQWMSWIALADYIAIVMLFLENAQARGAYNMTAPQPLSNAAFTQALAKAVHRPALFSAPSFALKLALGERAPMLLGGQCVLPQRALQAGFRFSHPEIGSALAGL